MTTATDTLTVTVHKERETKRTWRYAEAGDPEQHVLGTLYVPKDTLAKLGDPDSLTVTMEAV